MASLVGRAWKYLIALLTGKLNEHADPKVQLEQAISEAQQQHRELKEQAANVISNQKRTEMRLQRAQEETAKLAASAEQALVMQAEAADAAKAQEYAHAAENITTRMIALEEEIATLEELYEHSVKATDKAKDAVARNSQILQSKIAEQQQLLSKLDQAKMQEQVNSALSTLTEQVGRDVPTFDEVRAKIDARSAKAAGTAELEESSVEGRMLEVEQAVTNTKAQARLSEMRSKLGLSSGQHAQAAAGVPADARTAGAPEPASPAPAAKEADGTGETPGEGEPRSTAG